MKIGNYQAYLIDAGRFRLDGGAMFGVVPKTLWQKKKPADDKNRILMAANLLLLKNKEKQILIDTGIGDKFNKKLADIYGVDYSEHHLKKSLASLNLTPADITDVILTHLHFDHVGGATFYDEHQNLQATFPNAQYYLQKRQFDWAMNPSAKDQASFFPENYLPLKEKGQLILLEKEGEEILPGIEVFTTDGHTPGQQIVLVRGQENNLLYAADLFPTASHIPIPWVMAYDLYPMKTIEEKKHYLKLATAEEWLIFFEHDPDIHCGKIQSTEKGFSLKEKNSLV